MGADCLRLAIWAIAGAGTLSAQAVWTHLGPQGGQAIALAIDADGTLYAATEASLSTSADAGASWSRVLPGPACCVSALLPAPHATGVFYAVTRTGGIHKSTDSGSHWTAVNTGLPAGADGSYSITSLVIDPQTPDTAYAGSSAAGLFKTTSGGDTWFEMSFGLPASGVMALAIDPQDPDTLYASTARSGIYKSVDGGASWTASNGRLRDDIVRGYNYISELVIDPLDPATVYAAGAPDGDCDDCDNALFKSTDAGATWVTLERTPLAILALASDRQHAGTVYAGASYGIFKSVDGGATWAAMKSRSPGEAIGRVAAAALAVDDRTPDTVYAADIYTGVIKTTDAGGTWATVNPDLRMAGPADVISVRVDPRDPATIYAGTDAGVYKTEDGGATWNAANAGLWFAGRHLRVPIIIVDPQGSGVVYAADNWQDVFKSTDGGATWAGTLARDAAGLVVRGARLNINDLAMDPRDPRTFYVAGSYIQSGQPAGGAGVIRSADGGASWTVVNSGLPAGSGTVFTSVAVDPQNSRVLYAGTWTQGFLAAGRGIFKSTNGGSSWTYAGLAGYARVDVLGVDGTDAVYARSTSYGANGPAGSLFKSTNAGATWTAADRGIAGFVNALSFDPQNSAAIYAATTSGVYQSADGGANWTAAPDGLPPGPVNTLALDARGTLYAGTAAGVFVLSLR